MGAAHQQFADHAPHRMVLIARPLAAITLVVVGVAMLASLIRLTS